MTSRPRLRDGVTAIGLAFRADPLRTVASFPLRAVPAAANVVTAVLLRSITDSLVAGDTDSTAFAAAGLTILTGLLAWLGWVSVGPTIVLQEKTRALIERECMRLATRIPDLEHYERPDYLDRLELLRQNRLQLGNVIVVVLGIVAAAGQLVATTVAVVAVDPLLILPSMLGVVPLVVATKATRLVVEATEGTVQDRRRMLDCFSLATQPAAGKELRISGAGDVLVARHAATAEGISAVFDRAERRGAILSTFGAATFTLGYAVTVLLVVDRALRGQASAGDVVLVATLALQIGGQIGELTGLFARYAAVCSAFGWFNWLREHERDARARSGTLPVPSRPRIVELRGVTFRYPGAEAPALEAIDLRLEAGTTIGIVGENGAGKTTLAKLIAGMYRPTEGAILIDGIDLGDLQPEEWRLRLTAAFQDFVPFELTLRHAVGIGDLSRMDDEESVNRAVEEAGAKAVVAAVPGGLDAQLGKSFPDGTDLSGGQWQQLALARSMMRRAPVVRILDEPTANIDARTEHALFARYAGISRDSDAINVLISHRFSTLRDANVIVVIDEGSIVETGTHAELMQQGGLYAELYDLQARDYR